MPAKEHRSTERLVPDIWSRVLPTRFLHKPASRAFCPARLGDRRRAWRMSVRSNEVTERRALVPQRACTGRGRRNGIDLLCVYRGQRSDARPLSSLAASTHHLSGGISNDANGEGMLFALLFNVTEQTLVASK